MAVHPAAAKTLLQVAGTLFTHNTQYPGTPELFRTPPPPSQWGQLGAVAVPHFPCRWMEEQAFTHHINSLHCSALPSFLGTSHYEPQPNSAASEIKLLPQ